MGIGSGEIAGVRMNDESAVRSELEEQKQTILALPWIEDGTPRLGRIAPSIVASTSLVHLILSGNGLGDTGAILVSEIMSGNRSIQRLNLTGFELPFSLPLP